MQTILLIEDNANNATLVKRILKRPSLKIEHAWTGKDGLQMAIETLPDLILLDLGLPDLDGQTVASLIRRIPGLEKTPMLAVTAWPEETAREMIRAYGCDDYISKPIDRPLFLEMVARYLSPTEA